MTRILMVWTQGSEIADMYNLYEYSYILGHGNVLTVYSSKKNKKDVYVGTFHYKVVGKDN